MLSDGGNDLNSLSRVSKYISLLVGSSLYESLILLHPTTCNLGQERGQVQTQRTPLGVADLSAIDLCPRKSASRTLAHETISKTHCTRSRVQLDDD